AVLVDADDVAHAARLEDLNRSRACSAHPGDDDADPPEVSFDDAEGVEQRREDDNGGAVLVVVEDGNVELLAKALLDLEAAGRGGRVLLDRQREGKLSVVAGRQADAGDPGRVRHREVVTRADRDLVAYLDLPAEVHQEGPVGDVPDADARDVTEPAHDLLGVNAVARLDGDVAQGPLTRGLDEVDRADIPARFADGGRDAAQHARA